MTTTMKTLAVPTLALAALAAFSWWWGITAPQALLVLQGVLQFLLALMQVIGIGFLVIPILGALFGGDAEMIVLSMIVGAVLYFPSALWLMPMVTP